MGHQREQRCAMRRAPRSSRCRRRCAISIWLRNVPSLTGGNKGERPRPPQFLGQLRPQFPTCQMRFTLPFMFGWLRKRLAGTSPLTLWNVELVGEDIITSDGQGAARRLAIRDLRRVVVATDDSGPWGADVVFLLYSDHTDPAGMFPLEANGRDKFLEWLVVQPGYRDRELAKAMGSTQVARFEILSVQTNGS